MTRVSRLRLTALALAATISLTACGAPGHGDPGVAAVYRDKVITQDDVFAVSDALDGLYQSPHPGEALTLILIGPGAVAIAEEAGFVLSDQDLISNAAAWQLASKGLSTTPTRTQIELIRVTQSLEYINSEAELIPKLIALAQDIEANTVASPRTGQFLFVNFGATMGEAATLELELEGQLVPGFIAYKDVDGFTAEERPDWISGG